MNTIVNNLFAILMICAAVLVLSSMFNNAEPKKKEDEEVRDSLADDIAWSTDILDCITAEYNINRLSFLLNEESRDRLIELLNKKKIEVAKVTGIKITEYSN